MIEAIIINFFFSLCNLLNIVKKGKSRRLLIFKAFDFGAFCIERLILLRLILNIFEQRLRLICEKCIGTILSLTNACYLTYRVCSIWHFILGFLWKYFYCQNKRNFERSKHKKQYRETDRQGVQKVWVYFKSFWAVEYIYISLIFPLYHKLCNIWKKPNMTDTLSL